MRRIVSLLIVFMLLFTLCCCSRGKETVLIINDSMEVPMDLYRFVLLGLREKQDSIGTVWDESSVKALQSDTLEVLRQYYGVLALCKDYGIDYSGAEIQSQVSKNAKAAVKEYGGEDAFLAALKASYMTYDVYAFLEGCELAKDELFYAMLREGAIQTDEATLKAIFASDELIRIKQILIDPDKYTSLEEARSLAETLRTRAMAGEDFDKLVTDFGNDLFMFSNKDGYYMMKGVWFHTFEDTAFSLQIGEVSEVIETPAGFSVLKRFEKDPSYLEANYSDLAKDYYDSVFSLAIERKSADLSIQETDFYKSLNPLEITMP